MATSTFSGIGNFPESQPIQIFPFHAGVRSASSGLAGRTGGGIIPFSDQEKPRLFLDPGVVEDCTRTFAPGTGVGASTGSCTCGEI